MKTRVSECQPPFGVRRGLHPPPFFFSLCYAAAAVVIAIPEVVGAGEYLVIVDRRREAKQSKY